ncbi:flagellar biosynthetic protein FliO [bacterium]|nr:flagellar biosynthetic protein FliO [bacterium]
MTLKYMTAFIFYTLAMIGVIVIAYVVWKNSLIMAVNKKKGLMQIEESLSLAPRKTLHIIKIDGERFLIASDIDKTTFLAKLGESETIKNAEKYIQKEQETTEKEAEKKSQGGEIETFSMRKLLNKLANEEAREEEWM